MEIVEVTHKGFMVSLRAVATLLLHDYQTFINEFFIPYLLIFHDDFSEHALCKYDDHWFVSTKFLLIWCESDLSEQKKFTPQSIGNVRLLCKEIDTITEMFPEKSRTMRSRDTSCE